MEKTSKNSPLEDVCELPSMLPKRQKVEIYFLNDYYKYIYIIQYGKVENEHL